MINQNKLIAPHNDVEHAPDKDTKSQGSQRAIPPLPPTQQTRRGLHPTDAVPVVVTPVRLELTTQ